MQYKLICVNLYTNSCYNLVTVHIQHMPDVLSFYYRQSHCHSLWPCQWNLREHCIPHTCWDCTCISRRVQFRHQFDMVKSSKWGSLYYGHLPLVFDEHLIFYTHHISYVSFNEVVAAANSMLIALKNMQAVSLLIRYTVEMPVNKYFVTFKSFPVKNILPCTLNYNSNSSPPQKRGNQGYKTLQ